MPLFNKITEKPWQHQSTEAEFANEEKTVEIPEKTALYFFLSVVSVLFFLFIITFLSRSQFSDFEALSGEPWQPFTDATQLWLNTLVLLLSSASLQWALISSRRGNLNATIVSLPLAGLFAFLFLVAQLWVWKGLAAQGFYVYSNPANSFYYMLTAIHGLHLLGGLIVLSRTVMRFWQGVSLENVSASLQLCATYWHYLFIVWLILFALLTSSADTFSTIAALCGF